MARSRLFSIYWNAMSAECAFLLNLRSISSFYCAGFGGMPAFSGNGRHIDDPAATAIPNDGPLPIGTYYIVDRQSGGRMEWLHDFWAGTNRSEWFALYRNDGVIDDWTFINGVRRGNFRLHPVGYWGISEGCITVPDRKQFALLQAYLKAQKTTKIPGTNINYYGRVTVK